MSLLVLNSPFNCAPNNLWRQLLTYMMDGVYLQSNVLQPNYRISFLKSRSHSFSISSSILKIHSTGNLHFGVNVGESSQITRCHGPQIITKDDTVNEELQFYSSSKSLEIVKEVQADSSESLRSVKEVQVDSSSESLKSVEVGYIKETERRRKIATANKGKRPWNKGKSHSAETREKIKQRTIEALRNPKVKEKMVECRCIHTHSEEVKAKIGASQRLVWDKRLRPKTLAEKLFSTWAKCIAEAAKTGGYDQKGLGWDSYEKIKEEVALRRIQEAKDKVLNAAELKAARKEAKKIARLAQKQKLKEEKEKARILKRKKSQEVKQEVPESKELKLIARIIKDDEEKPIDSGVVVSGDMIIVHEQAIEKLDLEFVRSEKLRREVSLADQIQAAKKKRAESVT